jgi:hypothetical protein
MAWMDVRSWIAGEFLLTDAMIDGLKPQIHRWTERPPGMNPIAYSLWHIARAQDVLINGVIREREQLYLTGWDQKVGLPTTEVGLDFTSDEVDALGKAIDVEALYGYWRAVREGIAGWVSEVTDDELERVPDIDVRIASVPRFLRPEGQSLYVADIFRGRPVSFYLQWETLFHANLHTGEMFEIRSARSLLARRSSPGERLLGAIDDDVEAALTARFERFAQEYVRPFGVIAAFQEHFREPDLSTRLPRRRLHPFGDRERVEQVPFGVVMCSENSG